MVELYFFPIDRQIFLSFYSISILLKKIFESCFICRLEKSRTVLVVYLHSDARDFTEEMVFFVVLL